MPKDSRVPSRKSRNNEQAVFIQPGRATLPRHVEAQQFSFVMETGPYYRKAFKDGEKKEFLKGLFELWFKMWPELPKSADDFEFAIHRQQVTRHYVQNELHFAGSFNNQPCDKSWEEFLTQKTDEFEEMKEHRALQAARIRPRPIKKTPAQVVAPATNTQSNTISLETIDQPTFEAACILTSMKPRKRLVPKQVTPPNYIIVDDSEDEDKTGHAKAVYIDLDAELSDANTKIPVMRKVVKIPVRLGKAKKSERLEKEAEAASSSK